MAGETGFDGGVVVVSGALSGIGKACADQFRDAGAAVIGLDIAPGADIECDVTDADQVANARDAVLRDHGRVDVLVNVAGGAELGNVVSMDLATWERQLRFNLTSVYLMCHAFAPSMIAAERGCIVNTSSGWGFRPAPGRAAYAAAKAGIVAFSRSLAAEVAASHVRVNVVAPGPTETARMEALTRDDPTARQAQAAIPLGRLVTPSEVAAAVLYLASPAAASITGQTLHVNGGVFMP
ncbi:MAG: SDR family oxidoreductase [Chloroflexi bacterium]|nr:SDR family oxidoreductase [Chloroflexota bacterium]